MLNWNFLKKLSSSFVYFKIRLLSIGYQVLLTENTALLMGEVNLGAIIYFFVEVDDNADFCLA